MSCLLFVTEIHAQKRIALIIGNGEYEEKSLRNPANDAADLSKVLEDLGFEVDLKLNVNLQQMEKSIRTFGEKLHDKVVGLFYYSGHGVQYEGNNYLIPIGAMSSVSAPEHLRYKTVNANYILGVMKQAENGLNIVFLDACRDNPFRSFSRSLSKGLKRISGAEGTIIAYSTAPGKLALDGKGRNSPYTAQLIESIKIPNIPVELMLKQVRNRVKNQTDGKQSPWYEASIDGNFFFNTNKYDPSKTYVNSKRVREVQQSLKSLGYDPGVVDGILGTMTTKAILLFQQTLNIKATGILDRKLENNLAQALIIYRSKFGTEKRHQNESKSTPSDTSSRGIFDSKNTDKFVLCLLPKESKPVWFRKRTCKNSNGKYVENIENDYIYCQLKENEKPVWHKRKACKKYNGYEVVENGDAYTQCLLPGEINAVWFKARSCLNSSGEILQFREF